MSDFEDWARATYRQAGIDVDETNWPWLSSSTRELLTSSRCSTESTSKSSPREA